MSVDLSRLLAGVEDRLLPTAMRAELMADLAAALKSGTHFYGGETPQALFHAALRSAFRDISTHPRGREFQQFLLVGPAPFERDLPLGSEGPWLSDDQTAAAVSYVHHGILEHFKGALAELLAVGPVLRLVEDLKATGALSPSATLHCGDAVLAHSGRRFLKGADFHVLQTAEGDPVVLAGLGEVKAGVQSRGDIRRQLARHQARAARGVRLKPSGKHLTPTLAPALHQFSVVPSSSPLSLGYRFLEEEHDGATGFLPDEIVAPMHSETVVSEGNYHEVTLGWSSEALYAVAFEMTLWYFECVGETIFAAGVPQEWAEMSPSAAGRNAAKMRLYDAFQRARNPDEWNDAVALYNSYSFGWAVGNAFRTIERDLVPAITFEDLYDLRATGPESLGWYRADRRR